MRVIIRLIASPKGSTMDSKKYVAYLRVSTKKQGAAGLGIDAQRSAVAMHVDSCHGVLIKEFVEVESGKRADRQKLHEAISLAQRSKAVLLVAKLDRLSRNVAFLSALMESGVEFMACDMPHANKFTVHIMAAMAEHEREMISQRT
jgi:DNA invertase Pin-like site-specific DNA recombinase